MERKERPVLATILQTEGSTPQIPGASALFSINGLVGGTLGGGILEAGAQERALICLKKKRSLYYNFELQGDGSSEEAVCGGSASILMEAAPGQNLEAFQLMRETLRLRGSGLLLTRIEVTPDQQASIRRYWLEEAHILGGLKRRGLFSLAGAIRQAWREGSPRLLKMRKERKEKGQTLLFLEPLTPLPQLVIAGAGHIGKEVARLGKLLNFEVTVIDDRAEFASAERFPEADAVIAGDIGEAIRKFLISTDTYIVIVTRGHRYDAAALRACIHSPAAYIGMIGSRRKVALMREEFLRKGWASTAKLKRVHAPIGLKIGSKTVAEIAVSIASQLVLVRSQKQKKETA